jgi:translation elongation factor P/translation initiation factor 5A
MKKSLDLVLLDKSVDNHNSSNSSKSNSTEGDITIKYVKINPIIDNDENDTLSNNDSGHDFSNIPLLGAKVKVGMLVFIKKRPCKVSRLFHFKPGKHGCGKVRMEGKDVFTSKKYMETISSDSRIYRPRVMNVKYILTDINDESSLSLMDDLGQINYSFNLPENNEIMSKGIKDAFDAIDENDTQVIIICTVCKLHEDSNEPEELLTDYRVEAYSDE